MAHWVILLCLLHGAVRGQEVSSHSLQSCCEDGSNRVLQDCEILPSRPSLACSIVHSLCCQSAARDALCDSGIKMAREQGACEKPFFQGDHCETKTAKVCCDCCTLGLIAATQASGCNFHGLSLGKRCTNAAQLCCAKNTSEPHPAATEAPAALTTEAPGGTDACLDSKCSQLCVANGLCDCHKGFKLQTDGVSCEDVNECLTGSHSCVYGQVCINTNGSFDCQKEASCGTGYELTNGNHCQDIDECALGTHNCEAGFLCTNTEGSFRCHPKDRCADGFIRDAVGKCIDINECVAHPSPCRAGQTCFNTVGSFTCRMNTATCGRGYHLTEGGTRCEDVDECRVGNVCSGHSCVNLQGTYRCECQPGYTFNGIRRTCDDMNECRDYYGRPCAHKCENTDGSFQCSCSAGFKLAPDGISCDDINECEANPCSQECTNVYGSFQCYCRSGYQLSDTDGITCEDIDECSQSTGARKCSFYCVNTPGSFNCTCPPWGYATARDGQTCLDIDECAAGTHTCAAPQSCLNVEGGFRCLSLECPFNYQKVGLGSHVEAPVTVRCIKVCQPYDTSCIRDPVQLVTHIALALPTFREFHQPKDLVLVQTTAAANLVPGSPDVVFTIPDQDDRVFFEVVRRTHKGMILGVIQQVKRIIGPREIKLRVAMDYVNSGIVSYRNDIHVHIFISQFWV